MDIPTVRSENVFMIFSPLHLYTVFAKYRALGRTVSYVRRAAMGQFISWDERIRVECRKKEEKKRPGRNRCRDWRRRTWRCSHLGASNLPSTYTYCLLETSTYYKVILIVIMFIVGRERSIVRPRRADSPFLRIYIKRKSFGKMRKNIGKSRKIIIIHSRRDLPVVVCVRKCRQFRSIRIKLLYI